MHKIKACIFDLDGVIVNTAKYHYLSWKRLAKKLGFNFTLEQNENLKGVSRMDSLDILLKIGRLNFTYDQKLKLAEEKNNLYVQYISNLKKDEILHGAEDFLKSVKENGFKTALGSVSKNAVTIINKLELTHYFDAIIDGNMITHPKPNPEVFLLGAKKLNIPPENCVVFEDSIAGIKAAVNAKMYSVGIGEKRILNNANLVVSSLNNMKVQSLYSL
ncbi:MAG: beta-phosphoglucomutase [Clostridium sp.]|nr:beta-phosphoglucomutase [Clostridium sp.]